ncbi:hypothetical protein SBA1_1180019 [Candidatus Sulfotelmatobacter kueseliae]|uniref:Uncharacterized protein n=1 Tax=Candidatus Sulfotelmatobacter kueseliae TaxID=2042962 RepID=A0A2U3K1A4_9BACT|nr:hypothetical protein SBA1_1180019 [Candidatus Sulfotelmatobacter kueseliae]
MIVPAGVAHIRNIVSKKLPSTIYGLTTGNLLTSSARRSSSVARGSGPRLVDKMRRCVKRNSEIYSATRGFYSWQANSPPNLNRAAAIPGLGTCSDSFP